MNSEEELLFSDDDAEEESQEEESDFSVGEAVAAFASAAGEDEEEDDFESDDVRAIPCVSLAFCLHGGWCTGFPGEVKQKEDPGYEGSSTHQAFTKKGCPKGLQAKSCGKWEWWQQQQPR
jgi:hypothetical protein